MPPRWSTKIDRSPSPSTRCPSGNRARRRFAQASSVRRSTVEIDVASVRLVADEERQKAQAAEQFRPHCRRRAVRAIDGQLEPQERRRFGKHGANDPDTRRTRSASATAGASPPFGSMTNRRRWPRPRARTRSVNFTAPGEDLDAVVFERVVRGRDHDTGVVGQPGEIRHGGRWHDAGARHGRSFDGRAIRQLRFYPRARLTCIASDEQTRRLGAVRQRTNQCCAEPAYGRRIERILTGGTPHAVGPEETGDGRISSWHW